MFFAYVFVDPPPIRFGDRECGCFCLFYESTFFFGGGGGGKVQDCPDDLLEVDR